MQIAPLAPQEFTRPVAVITGGWSQERDRSLLSGRTVADALTGMGIKSTVLDLDGSRDDMLEGLIGAELAFLAIAGQGAEDGRLQGLLETLGIPFTGSGVLASAVGMHKQHAKHVVAAAGVRVLEGVLLGAGDGPEPEAARITSTLGLPVIVKPVAEGGSIGVELAVSSEALTDAVKASGGLLMAERFVAGRSVSVGVLEGRQGSLHVLPVLEALTPDRIYSYAAKRGATACDYQCPAQLDASVLEDLRYQAGAAHHALGCWAYSRHDFIVDDAGQAWWLEVNTLPGLSRNGNLARMAEADGLTYEQLILHILRGARVDRRAQA
ncbi:D-alanine--D-alanine ligase [Streptomyces sp. Lzd4kr]|nr:D-alanine--D-alanine ligase [Streptomyces sp. Lzd4kr]